MDAGPPQDAGVDAGPAPVTAVPTDLTATAASSTQLDLTWTASSAGNLHVVGYTYAWADNNAFTGATYVFVAGRSTANATLIGFSAATTYYFKIKAEGDTDAFDSGYSSSISQATLSGTASVPTNLSVTAVSSSQIDLSWTPTSTNDNNVSGYTYAVASDGSFTGATYVFVAGRSTATAPATGLAPGTTYYFKLKAEGDTDPYDSAFSGSVNTATFLTSASVPANLAATPASSNRVDLSWTANSSSDTAVIGYVYAFDTDASFPSPTYTLVPANTSSTASEEGLTPSTTYYFKIKAKGVTDANDSAYSTTASCTTLASTAAVPTDLVATAASGTQIDLTWTANSSGDANVQGYTYAWANNSSFTGATYVYVAGRSTANTTKTGLSAGTTYYFKIKAEGNADSYDSAFSSSVTGMTSSTVAAIPANLSAIVSSGSQINLSWTANSNSDPQVTGYTLARATTGSFADASYTFVSGRASSTYSATGLSSATTYYFKIKAEGTTDPHDSGYSSSISATTTGSTLSGTAISPLIYGQNAWMPKESIGARASLYGKLEQLLCGADYESTGTCEPAEVFESGVRVMRYGGNTVDKNFNGAAGSYAQYLTMVDNMRANAIEPILQTPYQPSSGSVATQAQAAKDLVTYINGTKGRGVKYWTIGNEPNLQYGYGASQIGCASCYFKVFATAMKEADPTILIVGPDPAWYTTLSGPGSLTDTSSANDITGMDSNGRYFVDVVAFHTYPFSGQQDRAGVIANLRSNGGFRDDLINLRGAIVAANSAHGRAGAAALKMAVTEINVDYVNPSSDGVYGVGAKSFLGGQVWVEVLGIAMEQGVELVTFWSVTEGMELGYVGSNGTTLRPSYYHFQMLAQNFRGVYAPLDELKVNGAATANVKAFGAKDTDQIAVMIMNQEQGTSRTYTVRLNTAAVSGTSVLKIRIDADVAAEYSNPSGEPIAGESTVVLIFNSSGVIRKRLVYSIANAAAAPQVLYY